MTTWQDYAVWGIMLAAVVATLRWIRRLACGRKGRSCAGCGAYCPAKKYRKSE